MIVKVQQSLWSSDGVKRLFIYNKSNSCCFDQVVDHDDDLLQILGNRAKVYFRAKNKRVGRVKPAEYILEILNEVEDQQW